MLFNIFLIIIGLLILVAGAESLVRGASSLAAKLKVSPLIIGLTVVSFGTSAPELTVNMISAVNGNADIAIGNVIGSNIANILLILGVASIIVPLSVKSSTVWKEIPFALLGVVLVLVMGNDAFFDGVPFEAITRTDGIALLALMIIFMYYVFGLAKTEQSAGSDSELNEEPAVYGTTTSVGLTLGGFIGLVIGGKLLVDSAVSIASAAGLSEALIGLTIIGIGTSLPELATSVVAALRKQADIAIGNVVGSNIFNVFFVLGTTGTILQLPFSNAVNFDVFVSILATLLLLAFMFIGKKHRLTRIEGVLFLALYASYITYLVIRG